MTDARIISLCDQLVTTLSAAWTSQAADDAVTRAYVAPVTLDRSVTFAGRRVYVFPVGYQDEPATRDEDSRAYAVTVWVVERYPDALPIDSAQATAWFDERVLFVEETVYDSLDFGRVDAAAGKPGILEFDNRRVWTESARVGVYDWERMAGLQLFMAELEFTFRELVN